MYKYTFTSWHKGERRIAEITIFGYHRGTTYLAAYFHTLHRGVDMREKMLRKYLLPLAFAAAIVGIGIAAYRLNQTCYVSVLSTAVDNKSMVVLDAGHGGIDGGATANGIRESDINLQITQKTATFLRLMGYRVVLTRDGDYSIHDSDAASIRAQKRTDLKNRLSIMQSTPGAVCVSIHLNRYGQSYVHGAQVFYGPAAGSEQLASILQGNIASYLQKDNERKIKKADSSLYILIHNQSNPAVMVECGFISNPTDAGNLQDDAYQNQLAIVLGCSLLQYENEASGSSFK